MENHKHSENINRVGSTRKGQKTDKPTDQSGGWTIFGKPADRSLIMLNKFLKPNLAKELWMISWYVIVICGWTPFGL